ncbi:MAG TPA: hypothetical protein VGQ87_02660 [Patescibacteria group bacterium]|jgi:tRNA threonylcarbamoyl adenosine modification protein YeaZ|nr:hypothetical protein [Patescibacteria group bacterium]
MILFIDTSDFELAEIKLISNKQVFQQAWKGKRLSEVLLPRIKQLLKRAKSDFSQIDKVAVVVGPGHFSRIRSAVALSNALAYSLQIKIIGLKKSEVPQNLASLTKFSGKGLVLPFYGKEANITKPKKKYL